MNKAITLKDFFDHNYPDGYYVVWKVGKIPQKDSFLFGFSGSVVEYSIHGGFKDYPEWMDNTDDSQINIYLLHEIPTVEQLQNGDF